MSLLGAFSGSHIQAPSGEEASIFGAGSPCEGAPGPVGETWKGDPVVGLRKTALERCVLAACSSHVSLHCHQGYLLSCLLLFALAVTNPCRHYLPPLFQRA